MSALIEKDPRLASIVDKTSQRNLLDDPHPVAVDVKSGTARFVLLVNNGYEAPVEVAVHADQIWLQPQTKQLSLMGGCQAECIVHAVAGGEGEFGNLCFSWAGAEETYSEYVLVWRRSAAPPPPPPPPPGIKKKPAWMYYATLAEATAAARKLGCKTRVEYEALYSKDSQLHLSPDTFYADWQGWEHFLGKAT